MAEAIGNPRFLVTSGPGTGTVHRIPTDGTEVTVGREADNTICILDLLASKYHFAVRFEDGHTTLCDRKSQKGTWIDKQYHLREDLEHGARIRVGTTTMIYLLHEDPLDAVVNLQKEISAETRRIYGAETQRTGPLPRDAEAIYYRDVVNALKNIKRFVNGISDMNELLGRILDTGLDLIPARLGAILLNGPNASPDPADLVSEVYRGRKYSGAPASLLHSLDSRALSEVYAGRTAFIANKPSPVLCVPVLVDGVIRGVLYLDDSEKWTQFRFEAEHLELAVEFADNLATALKINRKVEAVQDRMDLLLESLPTGYPIIGQSKAIQAVLSQIANAAAFDMTVLILGESGTGKELVARAIHELSSRKAGTFAAVNCGGIPENLLQSELFGHARGGFTGAVSARKGKLRQANGGTVLLDEMGELPMLMQSALLRVLQEKKVEPVGEDKAVNLDVRILAATNVDLEKAVADGKFRRDLYHRLNVVTIHLPPLRERAEDIPTLTGHFLQKYKNAGSEITIAPEAIDALLRYSWPGNIRQLENAIQSAIVNIYRSSNVIRLENLPKCIQTPANTVIEQSREAADAILLAAINHRLKENGGNVREAAAWLGIGKTKAYDLLRDEP